MSETEYDECVLGVCPVHGGWSDWSEYGDCDKPCGGGLQTRQRRCNQPPPSLGGNYCDGNQTNSTECNMHDCMEAATADVSVSLMEYNLPPSVGCNIDCMK